jgi:hypothetical protein
VTLDHVADFTSHRSNEPVAEIVTNTQPRNFRLCFLAAQGDFTLELSPLLIDLSHRLRSDPRATPRKQDPSGCDDERDY